MTRWRRRIESSRRPLRRRPGPRGVLRASGFRGSHALASVVGVVVQAIGGGGRVTWFSYIYALGPGQVFGELAILDGEPRSVDAVAVESTRLLFLDRAEFAHFVTNYPRVALGLLTVLTARLRRDAELIQDATFLDVPARWPDDSAHCRTHRPRNASDAARSAACACGDGRHDTRNLEQVSRHLCRAGHPELGQWPRDGAAAQ